ncbi:flavodoxin domain-containing protein [Clostridium baratii]|uniref:flavodoxin domain-containing protein n=1 Tax=Clostridium baratii TaxID=1561 RepID=UPI0036F1AAB3
MNLTNILVMYQSKYGATKKYAEWLAEKLSCDLIKTKDANINKVIKYDTIILEGGIYASGIAGISFLKKNYTKLKDKKIVVFAVGASPYNEEAIKNLKEHNLRGELSKIPCFYCRGAWNEEKMSWKDRTLCNMLKKVVLKKDPSKYEPWEEALVEAIGSECDWTSKESINPIIDFIEAK